MLEVIYRVYEVISDKERIKQFDSMNEFGVYDSSSVNRKEVDMDCIVCDDRDHFKSIVKQRYNDKIGFRYSKKMQVGDLYCVIIGEHCYNTERYFNLVEFECAHCKAKVKTYIAKAIAFSDYEIRNDLYNIDDYRYKRFCSNKCKHDFVEIERKVLRPDGEEEFYIRRDMFTEQINGYIYKITKKSTGEFYIGQTKYAPIFRWGQHLKSERFDISNILDYQFETLYIVPESENILEVEKRYIQEYSSKHKGLCLNIMLN